MTSEKKRWERKPNDRRERIIRYVQAFITAQMRSRKMTPAEFARFAGISKDAISTYLNGRAAPRDHQLWTLAENCGVSVSDIVPDYDDPLSGVPSAAAANIACPEFAMEQKTGGQVLLHIRKVVPFDIAIEIGRMIGATHAADRG